MTHATTLGVLALWLGVATVDEARVVLARMCAYDYEFLACGAGSRDFIWSDEIRKKRASCPQCLALCHLAMVEHDRFKENFNEESPCIP